MAIVDDLKQAHVEILEIVEGLSAEELTRPNAIGKWSARDVILHMAMWDGEALKAFAVWRTGHEYDWTYSEQYLKFNDFWHDCLKELSPNQVMQMFNLIRHALVSDISGISDEIWEKRGGVPKWLYEITIDHNGRHLKKLQAYRKSLGK